MRVGVVGVGSMGEHHGRTYASLPDVEQVCFFDADPEVARAAAGRWGGAACASLPELLTRVEAVSLCAPTSVHASLAFTILGAGVHLLIEKPICGSSEQARRLAEAIAPGLVVGVAHIERFNPVIRELRSRTRRPTRLEIRRHHPPSARSLDTTVVEDLMVHDIDLACHLLGETFDPRAARVESSGDADACLAELRTPEVVVRLSADRAAATRTRSIRIEDQGGVLLADLLERWVELRPAGEASGPRHAVMGPDALAEQLATFLACVRSHQAFPVTPEQAIRTLEVCERVRASCRPRRSPS